MKLKATLFFLLASLSIIAQQDAQFTQYIYNTININPAYAGSRGTFSIFTLHRAQWVGLQGAPTTNIVSMSTPIFKDNVGLGFTIMNDKIGPSNDSSLAFDFSYNINTSETYKLSFGLKATANLLNIDFTVLNPDDNNDYQFDTNINDEFSPDIGAGLYLYSDKTYVGLSALNLLETKYFNREAAIASSSHVSKTRIHYYLMAGHVLDINREIKFKPSILTKMVYGAPLQVDLSANFLINDKFVAGVSYRWNAAMSALAGFKINDSWFIGYGYDLEAARLYNFNSGSHEIFLRFELPNKCCYKIISQRFF